jgi:hypothetical protein
MKERPEEARQREAQAEAFEYASTTGNCLIKPWISGSAINAILSNGGTARVRAAPFDNFGREGESLVEKGFPKSQDAPVGVNKHVSLPEGGRRRNGFLTPVTVEWMQALELYGRSSAWRCSSSGARRAADFHSGGKRSTHLRSEHARHRLHRRRPARLLRDEV